jgi:hypothetical protein
MLRARGDGGFVEEEGKSIREPGHFAVATANL